MATLSRKYRLKQSFAAPNINSVKGKRFKTKIFSQGDTVIGNFYNGSDKTSFEDCVLVQNDYLIPINILELVSEIKTANFVGEIPSDASRVELKTNNVNKDAKLYTTGFAAGMFFGFLAAYYATNKGWFSPTIRNKVLIVLGGGIVGGYLATIKKK